MILVAQNNDKCDRFGMKNVSANHEVGHGVNSVLAGSYQRPSYKWYKLPP